MFNFVVISFPSWSETSKSTCSELAEGNGRCIPRNRLPRRYRKVVVKGAFIGISLPSSSLSNYKAEEDKPVDEML